MTTRLALPGFGAGAQSHLAAIGLLAVLHWHRPEWGTSMTITPEGVELQLHNDVPIEALGAMLINVYVPITAISPWNAGSGLGLGFTANGEQKTSSRRCPELDVLADGNHLWRATLDVARDLVDQARRGGWTKRELVAQCRNQFPDHALPWVDGCWDLGHNLEQTPRLIHNPSLGSGGNIGSADLGNLVARYTHAIRHDARAEKWLIHALLGVQSAPLLQGTAAHLDSTGLVNPWTWLLAMEGLVAISGSQVYRLRQDDRLWPCVSAAPDAHVLRTLTASETTHALWLPLWDEPCAWPALEVAITSTAYLCDYAGRAHPATNQSGWKAANTIIEATQAAARRLPPPMIGTAVYPSAVRNGQNPLYLRGDLIVTHRHQRPDDVWDVDRVAHELGIAPDSVRRTMSRCGVEPIGRDTAGRNRYPAAEVMQAASDRPGRGARTDRRGEQNG